MSAPATTLTDTFAQECREEFLRLSAQRATFNINEPGKRQDNGKARFKLTMQIDDVLDKYLAAREAKTLETLLESESLTP